MIPSNIHREKAKINQITLDLTGIGGPLFFVEFNPKLSYYIQEDSRIEPYERDIGIKITSNKLKKIIPELETLHSTIPTEIILASEKYDHLNSLILLILTRSELALQFANLNPVLFFLLINKINGHFTIHELNKIFLLKRARIAQIIHGEATHKHVKFLEKIKFKRGNKEELNLIINSLKSSKFIDGFSHWHKIPIQALYICQHNEHLIGSKILEHISEKNEEHYLSYFKHTSPIRHIYHDTIRIGEQLGFKNSKEILLKIQTPKQLTETHDKWTALLNKNNKVNENDTEFPPSPIPENQYIKHIKSLNQLIIEGKTQEHCVASYKDRILKKECYIYYIEEPERATIEVTERNGAYSIAQIKLKNNTEPSAETVHIIENWIKI